MGETVLVYVLCKPQPELVKTRTARTSGDPHTWERPPYFDADFYPLTGLSLQSLKLLSPLLVAFGVHTVLESLIAEEKSEWGILEQLVLTFLFCKSRPACSNGIQGGYFWGARRENVMSMNEA